MRVKFKKFNKGVTIPTKAHDSDFCYDCYAVSEEEIAPGVWKYGLGFGLQVSGLIPNDIRLGFNVRARSSVWKTGMILSNGAGTVDQGYTGEISVVFYHVMPDMPRYKVGDKVCQFCIEATSPLQVDVVEELSETDRGATGYGDSDKNK